MNAKINQLYANMVHEISANTVDSFKTYLETKVEIDEDMQSYFEDFKKQLAATAKTDAKKGAAKPKEEKKKRQLSPYNEYIKNKINELKSQGHSGNLMKLAVEAYNQDKKNGTMPSAPAPPQ